MKETGLYSLHAADDLYKLVLSTYSDYARKPTEKDFLFLVFGFTHLREWIAGKNHRDIESKKEKNLSLTPAELFSESLYEVPEYKAVQNLCNRGKHFSVGRSKEKTSKTSGRLYGIARYGNSYDQEHFLIDGKDSRDYFIQLIQQYNSWFDCPK